METLTCIGPQFTGLDMEMEIQKSHIEVLEMLEGVLLHIFRNLKGSYLAVLLTWTIIESLRTKKTALTRTFSQHRTLRI